MTTKYYLWGNGCTCWTIDLWKSHSNFERIQEFEVRKSKTNVNKEPFSNQARQVEYLECRRKAVQYLKKLSKETSISIVGGIV